MEIYLDNAATSWPKPETVYKAVNDFMRNIGTSSGRGAYRRALKADETVFETRSLIARLFNIADVSRVVFSPNATEAINLAVKGMVGPGDRVVTTGMEHNAVWRCLKTLERGSGIDLVVVPCDREGKLDLEAMRKAVTPATRLVVMTHASNVTGTIMPVEEVGAVTRENGIPLLVDTAQTAGVLPIDVERLQIDMLAFSGHKGLLGPQGTGGLYIREGLELMPLKEGGTGSDSMLEYQPEHLPDRFEAGTQNVAGIAGLGAAVQFILNESVAKIREREMQLTQYLLDFLITAAGITTYGPASAEEKVGVVSFNLDGAKPERVAQVMDRDFGVLVRAGIHCAPSAHRTIGTGEIGTVRVGLGYFNSERDIDYLAHCVRQARRQIS